MTKNALKARAYLPEELPEELPEAMPELDGKINMIEYIAAEIETLTDNGVARPKQEGRLRERLTAIARAACEHYAGDLLEIGGYTGETTKLLAEIAREYGRRVLVVDPWEIGTHNCCGREYPQFLRNTLPYADIVDVVRLPSQHENAFNAMRGRVLAFAFVDGLHTYDGAASDLFACDHAAVICMDDIRWNTELMRLFDESLKLKAWNYGCREGYLSNADY